MKGSRPRNRPMNPQPANHPVVRGGDLNGGQHDETISSEELGMEET